MRGRDFIQLLWQSGRRQRGPPAAANDARVICPPICSLIIAEVIE